VPEPFASLLGSERFEVASRGDLVPGRLWQAGGASGARPLVLIVPAPGSGKDAGEVVALARAIAAEGWAAAAIDPPLQGERASAKLSARLAACAAQPPAEGVDRLLWEEFVRQTALDLGATLDALGRRGALDAARTTCVAYAPAAAAEAWATREPRIGILLRAERGTAPEDLVRRLRQQLAAG
jgi:hypothetical protein